MIASLILRSLGDYFFSSLYIKKCRLIKSAIITSNLMALNTISIKFIHTNDYVVYKLNNHIGNYVVYILTVWILYIMLNYKNS